jgi:hypothetical protein
MSYEVTVMHSFGVSTFVVEAKSVRDARNLAKRRMKEVAVNYSIQGVRPMGSTHTS